MITPYHNAFNNTFKRGNVWCLEIEGHLCFTFSRLRNYVTTFLLKNEKLPLADKSENSFILGSVSNLEFF